MAGKQATNYPVYVVGGKDVHRKTRTLQKIRADLLGDDQGLGEIRFDGKTVDLPAVLDELRTPAFLADRKVVVVDDADKFITDYVKNLKIILIISIPTVCWCSSAIHGGRGPNLINLSTK